MMKIGKSGLIKRRCRPCHYRLRPTPYKRVHTYALDTYASHNLSKLFNYLSRKLSKLATYLQNY